MKLDRASDIPLYVQIYDKIAAEIIDGYRAPGERLPSRRTLANELGVAGITVEKAYRKLSSDGFVAVRHNSGCYVSEDSVWNDIDPGKTGYKYNFSANGVETSKLPFELWSRLTREAIKEDTGLFQHGDKAGDWRLRQSIRRFLFRARGIRCRTEQIVIGPGADDLLRELFILLARDSVVLLNNYYSERAVEAAVSAGAGYKLLRSDLNGLDTSELVGYSEGVLLQRPVHDWPSSATLSEKQLDDIIGWSGDGRYVIEDGGGYDYTDGKGIKTLWERSGGRNVIYLSSFSTTIAPSMKIAYLVADEEIIKRLFRTRKYYTNRVSRIEQMTLSRFIDKGHYEEHLEYMRSVYKEKRKALKRAFEGSLPGGRVRIYGADEGIFVIVQFDLNVSEEDASRALEEHGIKAWRLSQSVGDEALTAIAPHSYIVGFGELTVSKIKAGVKLWVKAWENII